MVVRGLRQGRGMNSGAQRIFRGMRLFCGILQWGIDVTIRLSKLIQCTTQRANPNVNCGLQLIKIDQYWLINCIKSIPLMQDVNNRANGRGELEGGWKFSVLSAPFFCIPKTASKKVYLKKRMRKIEDTVKRGNWAWGMLYISSAIFL